MGDLRPSRDQSGDTSEGSILGSILGRFWVNSRTLSQKPHQKPGNSLHLAVGRALSLEYD